MLSTSRFLRPLLFLRVRMKGLSHYLWMYPLLWSFLFWLFLAAALFFFQADIASVLQKLVKGSSTLLAVLPGIFILVLMALAAIKASNVDVPLQGGRATLKSREGEVEERDLSRRRFLCLLFGYLAFLGLTLFFVNLGLAATKASFVWLVCAGIYSFFFFQMVSLILLALFYFCDRIYWEN